MQTIQLNNGVEMPVLGYGVFQVPPEEAERCVSDAFKAGYRMIDTAQAYGDMFGSWRAMKKAYRSGKVRAIGVSNFQACRFYDFASSVDIKPAVNQLQCCVLSQQRGIVAIPKSMHKERMATNFDIFDFSLTEADMKAIEPLNQKDTGFRDFADPNYLRRILGMFDLK